MKSYLRRLLWLTFLYPTLLTAQVGGLNQATAIGPFLDNAFPTETPGGVGGWELVDAFPNLTFVDPIQMLPVPGRNEIMVAEKIGRLVVFSNTPSASTKTTLIDFSSVVSSNHDSGFLGFAFHPEFGQNGSPNANYIYIYYRYTLNTSQSNLGYCRLSRVEWQAGTNSIDPNSEFVMINQYDRHNWHNGGGLFFGNEGFLYLSIGDEGAANDQYNTGQKINVGLLAGVLRIDVDQQGGQISHPIRRQPQNPTTPPSGWPNSYSQGYYIPNDNPWLDPNGGNLEEFWAIGTRSPHRMTIDRQTGDIYLGEVGQSKREDITLVEREANLQWPYMEGSIAGPKPKPSNLIGFDQPPLFDYGRNDGGCVCGGYVYRGQDYASSLGGKYIFGDHNTSRIWSLTRNPDGTVTREELVTLQPSGPGPKRGLSGFGEDADGEIYALSLAGTNQDGGKLLRLQGVGSNVPDPPALLSQTGTFTNLTSLTPRAGLIPYTVNAPLWTDGADKLRWIALPNDGNPNSIDEQIVFSENGNWVFPQGTVIVKQFNLLGRKMETRFLIHGDDGKYYGLTYRWRDDQSDADLLVDREEDTFDIAGQQRTWTFPSRSDCLQCHTSSTGRVLGVRTRQLNGDLFYPQTGRTANQLVTLNQLGFLTPTINETLIGSYLTSVPLSDTSASNEHRARSYLDSNCAHCHNPVEGIRDWDFRLSTPLDLSLVINAPVLNDLGISGARELVPGDATKSMLFVRQNTNNASEKMPPLGRHLVDTEAMTVIGDWINGLNPNDFTSPGLTYKYYEGFWDTLPDFDNEAPVRVGSVLDFDLSPRLRNDNFAFLFEGQISITTPGTYTFFTTSDDGSKLWIDGQLVVDNDGLHPPLEASGQVTLSGGLHDITAAMFEAAGGELLEVSYAGPGISKQIVPPALLTLPQTNLSPVIAPIADQTNIVDNAVFFQVEATDQNEDPLTYSATGLPTGLGINPTTGIVSGTPTTLQTVTTSIEVSDGKGGVDQITFQWSITPDSTPQAGVAYDYYEGDWDFLPDFDNLTPIASGTTNNFDLTQRLSDNFFSFQFRGIINLNTAGNYTFFTTSDDGSRLWINGNLVVDNDGRHGAEEQSGSVDLSAGSHEIIVGYFERKGGEVLEVSYAGPGISKGPIPDAILTLPTNTPPTIQPLADQNRTVGDAVILPVIVSDLENDPITFSSDTLPDGLIINENTGVISGTLLTAGASTVTVVAQDAAGGTDSESFLWIVTDPGGAGGLAFDYYEGVWDVLPNFDILTPELSGSVNNFDLSPRLRNDHFAFRYRGYLSIQTTGDYTFYTTSDDGSRLWLNGELVVDNDGRHGAEEEFGQLNLPAGDHEIVVGFFEASRGQTLEVKFEGPGFTKQTIPDSLLSQGDNFSPVVEAIPNQTTELGQAVNLSVVATDPENDPLTYQAENLPTGLSINPTTGEVTGAPAATGAPLVTIRALDGNGGSDETSFTWTVFDGSGGGGVPGLVYDYYEGEWDLVPDFSSLTPLVTGTVTTFNLTPRLRDFNFAMRFQGEIDIPIAGDYTFSTTSDDGSLLWIDGQLVVNNDGRHGAKERNGTIALTTGYHDIVVGYFERGGKEILSVTYEGPGVPKQEIPVDVLAQPGLTGGGSEAGNQPSGLAATTGGSEESNSWSEAGDAQVYRGLLWDEDGNPAGEIEDFTVDSSGGFAAGVALFSTKTTWVGGFEGNQSSGFLSGAVGRLATTAQYDGDQIVGTIGDLTFTLSPVLGNAGEIAGTYTLLFRPSELQIGMGDGYGTLTIAEDGSGTFQALMSDATEVPNQPIQLTTEGISCYSLSPDGIWSAITLQFQQTPGVSALNGEAFWSGPDDGTSYQATAIGSNYAAPEVGSVLTSFFGTDSGELEIRSENLEATISIRWSDEDQIESTDAEIEFSAQLDRTTGVVSGELVYEDRTIQVGGVAFTEQSLIGGLFEDDQQVGQIQIRVSDQ